MAVFSTVTAAKDINIVKHYRDTANKLIDAALADQSGYDKLTYLCDRIGNRLSGSENLPKAITWAAEQMKKDGLVNVSTPPVKVPRWVRGRESGTIVAPVERPLHLLGLGMSVATPADGIKADAVVVSNFDELDKLGSKASGKVVVFDEPYEDYDKTVAYRTIGPSRAAKVGAVAVLVRSITPLAMQLPHTGTLRYAEDSPKIPAAAISIEDAKLLRRLQASGATPRVHLSMEAHTEPDVDSANVIGEIPGSEHPEEIVVMGGHIDSWDVGQGAQDDAAGVMATLEAAALMHKLGLKPRRTIRVVFWVNEENGGRGGLAYLRWAGDTVKNHVAAVEMDEGAETPVGIGYGPELTPRRPVPGGPAVPERKQTVEEQESMKLCGEIAALLKRIKADRVKQGGGGSDVEPLGVQGVPTLGPTTTVAHYFDWHHTQADTVDKVDRDDFRKNVALLAVLAYVLADMPGRLAGTATPVTD
ncbi:MAG: M20/M25/M40 family metallo-hydrolase [Bryobacteraceae bacterium]